MQPSSTALNPRLRDHLPLVLGLLLLVSLSSLADLLVGALPFDVGDIRWRYQMMFSILSSATQTGLFLALFLLVGIVAEMRTVVRIASLVAIVIGAIYLVTMPFFGLDFIVARRLIQVNGRHAFDMQWGKTTVYVTVLAIALIWSGVRCFLGTPRVDLAGKKREVGEGLVVGQG